MTLLRNNAKITPLIVVNSMQVHKPLEVKKLCPINNYAISNMNIIYTAGDPHQLTYKSREVVVNYVAPLEVWHRSLPLAA